MSVTFPNEKWLIANVIGVLTMTCFFIFIVLYTPSSGFLCFL